MSAYWWCHWIYESMILYKMSEILACRWCDMKCQGITELLGFIVWEPLISVQNFMAIYPIIIRIFESGPKWWNEQQSDIAISQACQLAWLKKIALLKWYICLLYFMLHLNVQQYTWGKPFIQTWWLSPKQVLHGCQHIQSKALLKVIWKFSKSRQNWSTTWRDNTLCVTWGVSA